MADDDIPLRHLTFTLSPYLFVMPATSGNSRPPRSSLSRRQVLAAGGTGLLAATAGHAKALTTRMRRTRAAAGAGTPEQIHLTWGEDPAASVVVSWASPG
jgi:hypothetical protein